jgi:thiamine kinase-like enzyme
VPGLEQGTAPLLVQRLPGGSVNHVWRVDTGVGCFVLRCDAPLSRRPGVDRERERQLQTLAAEALIAPRIIARTPSGDAQVSEYIDARPWQAADYGDARQLRRLGETLALLHSIKSPELMERFAPLRLARAYALDGAAASLPASPVAGTPETQLRAAAKRHAEALCQAVAAAERQLPDVPESRRVVHGDPTAGNVLDRHRLWLIDWEYAQCADPVFDVAAVLVYNPEARVHRALLLAAAGQGAALQHGQLAAAVTIHAALGWLWQYARGEMPTISAGISAPEWAN